jgi:hypothetical protein
MRYKLLAAVAAFFFATAAHAQNAGTVTSNAFAVGRGAGKTGFASVLCTQAQLAVGQNAAAPICRSLTGDVTIDAAGVTAIGANKVTNSQLATAADGTIKSNISGGTAVSSDNTISAVLDKLLGTARGSIAHRGASVWSALTPGTSGFFLKSNGPGADLSFTSASGGGTVTSVGLTNTYGLSISGSPVTVSGNISADVQLSRVTNSLGADVAMNNTGNYFDGPSAAQGTTGVWIATGTVSLSDSAGAATMSCKLWDGTTVISSGFGRTSGAGLPTTMSLSGPLASPAGNIKISCRDSSSTSGSIVFNGTGSSKDSTLTVVRIQ